MIKLLPPESSHRDNWLAHPHTRQLLQRADEQLNYKHTALIAACRSSTDPDVRQALAEFEALQAVLSMLKDHT